MRVAILTCLLALFLPTAALGYARTRVYIDGATYPVVFNDGDTFRIQDGDLANNSARLSNFNTLESYGPVHQWGTWDPFELYVIAKRAAINARAAGTWHCTSNRGQRDVYGRLLLECPDLIVDALGKGLAHAYSNDDTPGKPEYLRVQRAAQAARRGMWLKGIPQWIVTSTHSASEQTGEDTRGPSNRLISTIDAHTEFVSHNVRYTECQPVCFDEIHIDAEKLDAGVAALQSNPTTRPLVADLSMLHQQNLVSRFARTDEFPSWVPGEDRVALRSVLGAMKTAGGFTPTETVRASCMKHVDMNRRFTNSRGRRAICLEHP